MTTDSIWKVRRPPAKQKTDAIPAVQHPLEETEAKNKLAAFWRDKKLTKKEDVLAEKYDFEDPLGATFGESESSANFDLDVFATKPRSISLDNTLENRKSDRSTFDIDLPDFQSWREKRAQIAMISRPREFGMTQIELLRARLKLLSDEKNLQGLKKAGDVSQKFLMLRENLISAWSREDRVEAFKIVTESAQLLQSIPPYSEEYPYYWLLAIDVVDTFGKLVYDRLMSKSNEARNKIGQTDLAPTSFTVEQVPKTVKDMAMNWFLKLSEIIDIPVRFYIECSMIACLRFFDEANLSINLERLALMCSQFPDDISSIFARVHISRYSMLISPTNRAPHWRVLHDYMQAPKDVLEDPLKKKTSVSEYRKRQVSIQGVAWLVQCVAHGAATLNDLEPLFAYCRKSTVDEKTFILISALVEGLPSRYLAVHAEQVLELVFGLKESFEEPLTRLGRRFTVVAPVEEKRIFVKSGSRSVWMRIADIADFHSFIECCSAWTAFIAKYYGLKDVKKILELVLMRCRVDDRAKSSESTADLINLAASCLDYFPPDNSSDCIRIATSSDFIKLVDLIGHDIESTSSCSRRILEILVHRHPKSTIRSVEASLMIIEKCRTMSKKYGLEETEEVKEMEKLVCTSLSMIDFLGIEDRNEALNLIVRSREDVGLRQSVLVQIVWILFSFTQHTHANMKSGKRKADFMRVCITNLSVTIPAIRDVSRRIRMTIQNIQMCLLANFLPQIEISTSRVLEDLQLLSTCSTISPLINQLLAVLSITPDGYRAPSLTHFSQLFHFVDSNHETWSKESKSVPLSEIYINMLRYLAAVRQVDQTNHAGDEDHLSRVDAAIPDVIVKLFSLANEPMVAVMALENVTMLFKIHEEFLQMRSTIRGLLKRSVGCSAPLQRRLEAVIQDLREEAESDQAVKAILQKLSLL